MRVGSLFSGIGGLDLGLERAGMTVAWQSEIDPYCSSVIAEHWPNVSNLGDVSAVDWSTVEPVELVCGGFPCQPVSLAGARRGQDDERWLWPEFARCVRALRPRYVLVENVPGLLVRGMGDVLGDLAACGYDTEWDCIPAAAVGAPHLRYRIFIVATDTTGGRTRGRDSAEGVLRRGRVELDGAEVSTDPDSGRREVGAQRDSEPQRPGQQAPFGDDADGLRGSVADTNEGGRRAREPDLPGQSQSDAVGRSAPMADADAKRRDGRPGIFGQGRRREPADGGWWAVEPDVGRVAHGIPRRVDRLRALGNAVVPQVAEWIGRRIMEVHG